MIWVITVIVKQTDGSINIISFDFDFMPDWDVVKNEVINTVFDYECFQFIALSKMTKQERKKIKLHR